MRIMLGLAAAMVVTFAAAPASAQVYPWCAQYAFPGGATNCGFATLQQCEWAISGNGGFCRQNQFYAPSRSAPRKKAQRG
jgi:hypothetical protein